MLCAPGTPLEFHGSKSHTGLHFGYSHQNLGSQADDYNRWLLY